MTYVKRKSVRNIYISLGDLKPLKHPFLVRPISRSKLTKTGFLSVGFMRNARPYLYIFVQIIYRHMKPESCVISSLPNIRADDVFNILRTV